jgi:hypothetical protein
MPLPLLREDSVLHFVDSPSFDAAARYAVVVALVFTFILAMRG